MNKIVVALIAVVMLSSCGASYYAKVGEKAFHDNDVKNARKYLTKAGDTKYLDMMDQYDAIKKQLEKAEFYESDENYHKAIKIYIASADKMNNFVDPNLMMKNRLSDVNASISSLSAKILIPLYHDRRYSEFYTYADRWSKYLNDDKEDLPAYYREVRDLISDNREKDNQADELVQAGSYQQAIDMWKDILKVFPDWSDRLSPKVAQAENLKSDAAAAERMRRKKEAMSALNDMVQEANVFLSNNDYSKALDAYKNCQDFIKLPKNQMFDLDSTGEISVLIKNARANQNEFSREQSERRSTRKFNKKWGDPLRPKQLAYTENYKISSKTDGSLKRGETEYRSVDLVIGPGEYRKLNCNVNMDYIIKVYEDPDNPKNLVNKAYDRNGRSTFIAPDLKGGFHKIEIMNTKGDESFSFDATLYKILDF